ncbi:MAG: hypothetical protein K0R78_1759 [Pelosinus sp.]|jgi:hypothetical protein|nr:hypothetical protein [Pelosinus sp.]
MGHGNRFFVPIKDAGSKLCLPYQIKEKRPINLLTRLLWGASLLQMLNTVIFFTNTLRNLRLYSL